MPLLSVRAIGHCVIAALLWGLVVRGLTHAGKVDLGTALDVVAVTGLALATGRWTARIASEAWELDRLAVDHPMRSLTPELLAEETQTLRRMAEVAYNVRCPGCGHLLAHGHVPLGLLTECPHCHSGVAIRMRGGKAEVQLTGI